MTALLLALATLTVRVADADLTPPEPLPLGGYTERRSAPFEAGGPGLVARTLVLEAGGRRLAWVAVETLTIPESLVSRVRKAAPTGTDVVLSATHTHCAPDSQMLNERMTIPVPGIATYRSKWLDWYADRISQGIRAAMESEPRPVGSLRARLARTEGMNRARRQGEEPDRTACRIEAEPGVLFDVFAAHPVLLGPSHLKTDPEWTGRLMRRSGGLALVGALGDVSPVPPEGPEDERPARYAEALAAALERSPARPIGNEAEWTFEPIALGRPEPHPEFSTANKVPDALARLVVARFAPPQAEVTLLRLGRALIVGVPGEPTTAVGRRLREAAARKGYDPVLVASHVGGWIGYILTPEEYREGGYEATLAFHGPALSDRLLQAVERGLQRMSQIR